MYPSFFHDLLKKRLDSLANRETVMTVAPGAYSEIKLNGGEITSVQVREGGIYLARGAVVEVDSAQHKGIGIIIGFVFGGIQAPIRVSLGSKTCCCVSHEVKLIGPYAESIVLDAKITERV